MQTFDDEDWLELPDVAKRLKVSMATMRRIKNAGLIGYFRIGGRIKFTEAQVAEYLATVQQQPAPPAPRKPPRKSFRANQPVKAGRAVRK